MTTRPKLTHAGVHTRDLQRMLQFYTQVLGLIVTDQGVGISIPRKLIFLSSDPAHHHQFVLSDGRPQDAPSTVNQLSFIVPDLDGLREVKRRAIACNVETFRAVNHGNAWSLYFDDPEENLIEIYTETPWYVPQPYADLLNLDSSNEEIFKYTQKRCLSDPNVMSVDQWRANMQAQVAATL